jgi:hypothetical protein
MYAPEKGGSYLQEEYFLCAMRKREERGWRKKDISGSRRDLIKEGI